MGHQQRASPYAPAHCERRRKEKDKGATEMNQAILPLAITMMAGPQIMSAIIFVTASKPVRLSVAFLAAVAIAAAVGVAIFLAIGNNFSLGDPNDNGSTGHIVQYVLVGLLVLMAVKNYVRRETVEPPKWLGTLQNAEP